ncbi:MAG: DeoR family transcriptional regulator, partial [Ginsengibacter sp.]
MLKKERQAFIIHKVNLHNKILSSDLSHEIHVSEDTIRRDLNELSEMKKIIKVHGGALSKSFHNSFQYKNIYSLEQKKIIAQKAVSLIKDGMFVLTTGGTTIIELARA